MPNSQLNRWVAVATVVASLALTGCATREASLDVEPSGPNLAVQGRISVKQVGKPLLFGSYEWYRGNGFEGWTERFHFKDTNGLQLFHLESNKNGTIVRFQDRIRKVESMRVLMRERLGIDIAPATMASWFENSHGDGELPDRLAIEGVIVEVLERFGDGRPSRLRLLQEGTVVLMSVRHGDLS